MKKTIRSIMCVFLCAVIALGCTGTAFAADSWSTYWNENSTDIQNGIYVAPGHTESERIITWYTDSAKDNFVAVSLNEKMTSAVTYSATVAETPQGDYSAEAYVNNLKLGETYYYTCNSKGYTSSVYSFTTVEDKDFSALYVTDVHISYDDSGADPDAVMKNAGKFASVVSQAKQKADIDLIVSAGDQASLGRRDEYCGFAASKDTKGTTVAILEGNHDRKNIDYRYFNANPETDVKGVKSYIGGDYWFVKGDVLFMLMDGNNGDGIYHRRFMKDAIKSNPDVKWRVAMLHHDLLGGRIPNRESENKLLRLIWLPLMDEFSVDLVLMGHSHYYTMSNVVYKKKSVQSTKDIDRVVNPAGTVYMVSGSINRPRGVDPEDVPPVGENVGKYVDTDKVIYNVLDFSEDSIVIRSYYDGENAPFNTFTIAKDSQQGGHPKAVFNPLNGIVRFIGEIYAFFNNIGIRSDLKEKYGIKLPLFSSALD